MTIQAQAPLLGNTKPPGLVTRGIPPASAVMESTLLGSRSGIESMCSLLISMPLGRSEGCCCQFGPHFILSSCCHHRYDDMIMLCLGLC